MTSRPTSTPPGDGGAGGAEVGARLEQARLARGLSLEQVATSTRIRGSLVRAMETGDFAACRGSAYARGHIRSLAGVYGIDPGPLVAEFNASFRDPDEEPALNPESLTPDRVVRRENRRRATSWPILMATAVVAILLVIGAAGVFRSGGGGGGDSNLIAQSPSPSTATPSPSPVTTTPAPAPSTPAPTTPPPTSDLLAAGGVNIVFTISGKESWVSAKEGKTVLFQGLMKTGDTKTVQGAQNVSVLLGFSPAVELTVNGKALGSPTGQGVVFRGSYGPGDPTIGQG